MKLSLDPLPNMIIFGILVAGVIQTFLPQFLTNSPPRSTECIFLGYPDEHKGYQCLDLSTNRIIISRHVVFDEDTFPFAKNSPVLPSTYSFLDEQEPDAYTLGLGVVYPAGSDAARAAVPNDGTVPHPATATPGRTAPLQAPTVSATSEASGARTTAPCPTSDGAPAHTASHPAPAEHV